MSISEENSNKFLKICSETEVLKLLRKRAGEVKLGERICFVKHLKELKNHSAKYILLGIPEDIGVRANHGKPGTAKAWESALQNFLNIQTNQFTNPENIILLGEINCDEQNQQAEKITIEMPHSVEKLGELVNQIDHKVSEIIKNIIEAGKFPIIIGGGHNNSYGNIKGASEALKAKVNCINFDAHTDFRSLEHRHSGNGFSYAFENEFLEKYFIFGLHRNYTSEAIFQDLKSKNDSIQFSIFEDISIKEKITFSEALANAETFCCQSNFGIELDMDAIENIGSSAITPSGFSLSEARRFIDYFSKNKNACYLHICEGSPKAEIFPNQIGKAISYLISDITSD